MDKHNFKIKEILFTWKANTGLKYDKYIHYWIDIYLFFKIGFLFISDLWHAFYMLTHDFFRGITTFTVTVSWFNDFFSNIVDLSATLLTRRLRNWKMNEKSVYLLRIVRAICLRCSFGVFFKEKKRSVIFLTLTIG